MEKLDLTGLDRNDAYMMARYRRRMIRECISTRDESGKQRHLYALSQIRAYIRGLK